MKKYANLVEF